MKNLGAFWNVLNHQHPSNVTYPTIVEQAYKVANNITSLENLNIVSWVLL